MKDNVLECQTEWHHTKKFRWVKWWIMTVCANTVRWMLIVGCTIGLMTTPVLGGWLADDCWLLLLLLPVKGIQCSSQKSNKCHQIYCFWFKILLFVVWVVQKQKKKKGRLKASSSIMFQWRRDKQRSSAGQHVFACTGLNINGCRQCTWQSHSQDVRRTCWPLLQSCWNACQYVCVCV